MTNVEVNRPRFFSALGGSAVELFGPLLIWRKAEPAG
jgi:hypothetical protein